MGTDYKAIFETMLIFTPILMVLSYLAGTAHDMPKKKEDPLFGLKLKRKIHKVCSEHAIRIKGPSFLVSVSDCQFCKKEKKA